MVKEGSLVVQNVDLELQGDCELEEEHEA